MQPEFVARLACPVGHVAVSLEAVVAVPDFDKVGVVVVIAVGSENCREPVSPGDGVPVVAAVASGVEPASSGPLDDNSYQAWHILLWISSLYYNILHDIPLLYLPALPFGLKQNNMLFK